MICQNCQDHFDKKHNPKLGKINWCDDCSKEDQTVRAIGYNDGSLNKSQNISVYRGANKKVRKTLTGFRMV